MKGRYFKYFWGHSDKISCASSHPVVVDIYMFLGFSSTLSLPSFWNGLFHLWIWTHLLLQIGVSAKNQSQNGCVDPDETTRLDLHCLHRYTQLAFYVNLHRAVIGPSATLTGRWRSDIDLRRMLTGYVLVCRDERITIWLRTDGRKQRQR